MLLKARAALREELRLKESSDCLFQRWTVAVYSGAVASTEGSCLPSVGEYEKILYSTTLGDYFHTSIEAAPLNGLSSVAAA